MIKKSFRLMLLAAFALSSVMFVSCNKWEDEINELDEKVASLEQTVQNLQNAISGGAVVTGVTSGTDGVTFTMSNGQSYTVKHGNNGKDGVNGTNGTNGVDGKTPVITIDPETNNWVIDGVDTGICAKGAKGDKGDKGDKGETGAAGTNGTNGTNGTDGKDGQNGKDGLNGYSPKISENGFWMVYDDENQVWVETEVVAAFVHSYVIDCGSYYVLNVVEHDDAGEDAGWVSVKLPKTAVITSIDIYGDIAHGYLHTETEVEDEEGNLTGEIEVSHPYNDEIMTIALNYGGKLLKDVTFNGKTYNKGQYLIPSGNGFTAMINPLTADATKYEFALMDTHGNKPYSVTAAQNTSSSPLTRAANKGIWDMSVKFAGDPTGASSNRIYALATETLNGTVATQYKIKVKETKVKEITNVSLNNLSWPVNKTINLADCFRGSKSYDYRACVENKTIAYIDGVATNDLRGYLIDYYFEIVDELVAEDYGIKLNGNKLTAEKKVDDVEIRVNYLLTNGTKAEGTIGNTTSKIIKVSFTHVAESEALAAANWTINHTNKVVYVPLGDAQSALRGAKDTDLPEIKAVGYAATNGKDFSHSTNQKFINGAYQYVTDPAKEIATVDATQLYYKATNGYYYPVTASTKIQTPLYVAFTFDEEKAFPGTYKIKLSMNKANSTLPSGQYDYVAPVTVTINAPNAPVVKYDNYFKGNNATVYGEPNGNYVDQDLLDLFITSTNGVNDPMRFGHIEFEEEIVYDYLGAAYPTWLPSQSAYDPATDITTYTFSGSEISVPVYDNSLYADNTITVGSSHNFIAVLKPYGNEHIEATRYEFNVTVKSEIAAGKFTSKASKEIATSTPVKFFVTDFNAVDVYGDAFYFGNTYKYDEDGNFVGLDKLWDSDRIVDVTVVAADANATNYLTIGQMDGDTTADYPSDFFSVARKSTLVKLEKDTKCTVRVVITDTWGVMSYADVTVTLKAFGN